MHHIVSKLITKTFSCRIAEALHREGEVATGTAEDVERLTAHYTIYRGAYDQLSSQLSGYKENCFKLRKELQAFRKHAPLNRTPEQLAVVADKPSIIVATLPKSGTKYIGSTLSKTLGYNKTRSLYRGTFPTNIILPEMASEFAQGGMAFTGHIRADRDNMDMLRAHGLNKIVLHVRDPRACLYSWSHFFLTKKGLLAKVDEEFAALPFEQQVDHHIDSFFIDAVQWLRLWAEFLSHTQKMQVLVTSHDQLVSDEQSFFKSIFDFYDAKCDELVSAPKDNRTNFRSGDSQEWRKKLTKKQRDRMMAIIPRSLYERFGWTP